MVLFVSPLYVVSRIASGVPASDAGEFANLNWQLETLNFALLGFFAFNILRGRNWSRLGLCVVLSIDILRSAILEWSSSWHSLHLDILAVLLAVAALHGPGCRSFFSGNGKITPLTYQLGTVICYVVTTIFLTSTIALPSAYARLGGPDGYKYFLFACVPLISFGVGRLFRVVLDPRRDVGWMLVTAAVLSFGFGLSIYLRQAESLEAALRGVVPDGTINLWVMLVVAAIVGSVGVVLILQSSAHSTTGPPEFRRATGA